MLKELDAIRMTGSRLKGRVLNVCFKGFGCYMDVIVLWECGEGWRVQDQIVKEAF